MRLSLMIAALGLLAPGTAAAQVVRCDVTSKFRCEGSTCQPNPATVWSVVDFGRRTYSRCDAKGCDTHSAQFETSGAYINITLPRNGMLAKIGEKDFLEVATLGLVALVSRGTCRPS